MKGSKRFVRVNPTGAMILNGLIGGAAEITPPSGPYSTGVNYTFTASTSLTGATFDWTSEPGVTVVSGQGTDTAVIRFDLGGVRTVRVEVTGDTGRTQRAAWIDHVGASAPYSPSLDFSDARNSQHYIMGWWI